MLFRWPPVSGKDLLYGSLEVPMLSSQDDFYLPLGGGVEWLVTTLAHFEGLDLMWKSQVLFLSFATDWGLGLCISAHGLQLPGNQVTHLLTTHGSVFEFQLILPLLLSFSSPFFPLSSFPFVIGDFSHCHLRNIFKGYVCNTSDAIQLYCSGGSLSVFSPSSRKKWKSRFHFFWKPNQS